MHQLNAQAIRLLDQMTHHEIDTGQIEIALRNIRDELLAVPRNTIIQEPTFDPAKKRKKDTYNYKETEAYKVIIGKFGTGIRQQELVQIAVGLGGKIGVKVEREAKRRKDLLFKWFQENLEKITVLLPFVVAFDKDGHVLKRTEVQKHQDSVDVSQEQAFPNHE